MIKIIGLWAIFFQLSWSPLVRANTCNYPAGDDLIQSQAKCETLPGRIWSCATNRCMYNDAALDTNKNVTDCRTECVQDNTSDKQKQDSCAQDCFSKQADRESKIALCQSEGKANSSDPEALQKCADNYNLEKAGFLTDDFKEQAYHYSMFAVHGVFIIATVIIILLMKRTPCPLGSAYLMLAGSILALGGEVGAFVYMKVKLADLEKTYQKLTADTAAQDFQRQAFQGLASEHKIRGNTETARAVVYYLAASIFYLGALKAIYEVVTGNSITCAATAAAATTTTSSSATTGTTGATTSMVTAATKFVPPGATDGILKIIRQLFGNSITRAAIAAVFGSLSIVLAVHSTIAAKTSFKRVKIINQTLQQMQGNWSDNICENRTDPNKPQCYCYTDQGKVDANKLAVSDSCKSYFAQDAMVDAPGPTDYSMKEANGSGNLGCVNVNDEFDQNCTCQKILNSKGDNACKKTSLGVNLSGLGQMNGANQVEKMANDFLSGNGTIGALNNPDVAMKLAAKIGGYYNDKRIEAKTQLKNKGINYDSLKASAPAKIFSEMGKSAPEALFAKVGNFNSENSSGQNFNSLLSQEAKAKLEKNLLGAKSTVTYAASTAGGNLNAKKDSTNDFSFKSFAGGADSSGGQNSNDSGVLSVPGGDNNSSPKFANDDIQTRSSESIFQLISLRYKKSAYQKLFTPE